MVTAAGKVRVLTSIFSNPAILRARPSVGWFLCQYLRKFTTIDVGGNLVLHSHLPPLNSKAYTRFVREHLLTPIAGPSHAQVGITNACPQHCGYCYNKGRSGTIMETDTILSVIRDLKSMGVFWIGLTGGEPLLNKDLPAIVETIGGDCASKLFTTGCGLTNDLVTDLKQAGLLYVTISLDHWNEEQHDRRRAYKGAYRAALRAIESFLNAGSIHVSVSAVLSKEMVQKDVAREFLDFLEGLGIHEAWLSETKPSVESYWKDNLVISEQERMDLIALQDDHNARGRMTVNYLGHFEDARHFGCTAGHKMVYVDAFGDVNPCVFIPMTFGNVHERSVREIVGEMRSHFPSEGKCFINRNYKILQAHANGNLPIGMEESVKMMREIKFGPLARFFELQYR